MGFMDKAKDALSQHGDKVEQVSDEAITRAGDAVDDKTGGAHADKVDQAQQAADERIGDNHA